jgi:hypothetical protein
MRVHRVWTALLPIAGLAAALALAAPAAPAAQVAKAERTLAGAWMAKITFTANPPPSAPGGTEIGLQGFGSDGLLSEYATAGRTTGYGVWKATNKHGRFVYTFRELVFNSDNSLLGYVVVKQAGSVSADGLSYSSSGQGQVYTLAGTPLGPPSHSSTRATRIGS